MQINTTVRTSEAWFIIDQSFKKNQSIILGAHEYLQIFCFSPSSDCWEHLRSVAPSGFSEEPRHLHSEIWRYFPLIQCVMSPSVQLRPGLSRRLPPTVCSETLNRKSVQPPTRLSQLEKFLEPMADLRGAQGGHHLCHAGAVLQVRGETEGQGSVK